MNKESVNYSLQDIYNLTNTIIPILTILSILIGGFTSFIYLNSLGARILLLDFSAMEFTMIFIAWFIYMAYFYLFMYSSSISYHIFLNKYKSNRDAKKILIKYVMLSILLFLYILIDNYSNVYVKASISLLSVLMICYFFTNKIKGKSYIKNNIHNCLLFIFFLIFFLFIFRGLFFDFILFYKSIFIYILLGVVCILMFIELIFELKFVASKLCVFIIFFYPVTLLYLAAILISQLSYNYSSLYFYSVLISFLFLGLIGNYLLMMNIKHGILLSLILFILAIFIPSQISETYISYSIFSVVGMAEHKERAYAIDSDFLRESNIRLDNYIYSNGVKYICSKALVISSKAYVFKLHNKVNNKPNFYQIPIDKVRVYQGEECQS